MNFIAAILATMALATAVSFDAGTAEGSRDEDGQVTYVGGGRNDVPPPAPDEPARPAPEE